MFYYHTYLRNRKARRLMTVFQSSVEIKRNFKVSKQNIALLIPKYRIAIEFGEYDNTSKKIMELEKAGLRVVNIPDSENAYSAAGRLLYIIKNADIPM